MARAVGGKLPDLSTATDGDGMKMQNTVLATNENGERSDEGDKTTYGSQEWSFLSACICEAPGRVRIWRKTQAIQYSGTLTMALWLLFFLFSRLLGLCW